MFHKRNSGFSATSGHISFPTRALKPEALGLWTPGDVSSEVVKPGLLGVGMLRQGKYKEAWGGPRASGMGWTTGIITGLLGRGGEAEACFLASGKLEPGVAGLLDAELLTCSCLGRAEARH